MRRLVLGALAALAMAGPAAAWSNQGHMVTGAIAYDDLAAADPAVVAKVEAIMADHPDHARFERGLQGYTGAARTRRLFELMARWPDDIRGGPYDHPAWHYWLRPIVSVSDPPTHTPPALLKTSTGEAVQAYEVNLATVRDAFAPAAERAVALCWVFHLAGDMQQPLHAGHLVSGRFPLSDRAGGADYVLPDAGAKPVGLHQYWDDAIGGDEDGDANVERQRLRLEAAFPRAALGELTGRADVASMQAWADQSLDLARSVAYVDATFEGAATPAAAQPLPHGYAAKRYAVGSRRIALGGHRIADALRDALGAR